MRNKIKLIYFLNIKDHSGLDWIERVSLHVMFEKICYVIEIIVSILVAEVISLFNFFCLGLFLGSTHVVLIHLDFRLIGPCEEPNPYQ